MPEVLLVGYRNGFFPMAESGTGRIAWHRPDPRAIIPTDNVHISRSLRKAIQRQTFRITFNTAFETVVTHCSLREESWISDEIIEAYTGLHEMGYAHSVEAWQGSTLVGGLYGVHIGAAFFGESMFSTVSDASKVAFAHLVARLVRREFRLLDTQYINDFTRSLGAVEIPDAEYTVLLADAIAHTCSFA
ncbi:MAG: leucyl/phenylalanyl-tRNA--protein transferase [bacterium]|nr:leucyl/phenylalanyl-tRNA--protein transferase [bacterium]